MNEAGRQINAIARDFNSGFGTMAQLRCAVRLLTDMYKKLYALQKAGAFRNA